MLSSFNIIENHTKINSIFFLITKNNCICHITPFIIRLNICKINRRTQCNDQFKSIPIPRYTINSFTIRNNNRSEINSLVVIKRDNSELSLLIIHFCSCNSYISTCWIPTKEFNTHLSIEYKRLFIIIVFHKLDHPINISNSESWRCIICVHFTVFIPFDRS